MAEISSPIDICSISVDGHLNQIQQNLPRGRAWPRDPDTNLMRYWRSFAETVKYLEDRICALIPEFYCSTAIETIDIWAETYGVQPPDLIDYGAACLKPEYLEPPLYGQVRSLAPETICAKVAATGGSSCEYFKNVAAVSNWVVECEVPPNIIASVGCCYSGCVSLGPAFAAIGDQPLGFGSLSTCDFGSALNHPGPQFWKYGVNRRDVECPVPGSRIGMHDQQCCMHVGYFEANVATVDTRTNVCMPTPPSVYDHPAVDVLHLVPKDSTGKFIEYAGHGYIINFAVDTMATMAAIDAASPYSKVWSMAGCSFCGDPCAAIRNLDPAHLDAALVDIVPAHLKMNVRLA
jgi:hypothetical protein